MAIKPVIYKFDVSISDLNRHYYDQYSQAVALHPSETTERMMVRLLAYCLNADEKLLFTKGLSSTDEPDLWKHGDDGVLQQWVEVGEPTFDRIKKSAHRAPSVKVYSFNHKADTWWTLGAGQFKRLKAEFYYFDWPKIELLATMVERTMSLSVTITDNTLFVATEKGECELVCHSFE